MIRSYRELVVWQRSFALSIEIYKLTREFPGEELYGLTSQLRRSSVSIPSNIAEGYGRNTRRDYRNFVGIARGSALELQTQLAIAKELKFGEPEAMQKAQEQTEEVGKCYGHCCKSSDGSPDPCTRTPCTLSPVP